MQLHIASNKYLYQPRINVLRRNYRNNYEFMNAHTITMFLKFGAENHIKDLYYNGTIYMNSIQRFRKFEDGELILTNRNDTLSPILTLIENGKIKWSLGADIRNMKGYESFRIWKLSNLTVTKDTDPIKLNLGLQGIGLMDQKREIWKLTGKTEKIVFV